MARYLILFTALLGLAACETAKGAGKDIENVGSAISDAATEVQDQL